jgi:cobalamin biosynthesis Mg chelatase CobN
MSFRCRLPEFDFEFFFVKMLLSKYNFFQQTEKAMNEREEEQAEIKVTDKRKFNLDGTLREGVKIEPAKPKTEEESFKASSEAATPSQKASDLKQSAEKSAAETKKTEVREETELPGADDPASFVNFLSTLATNAAAALGAMPHPVTGQRTVDLDTGKYWLDVLAMLKEKTKGNLHFQESRLLDSILSDLRMQYVRLVKMTEEKLKAQAAQKFSASDILGKK